MLVEPLESRIAPAVAVLSATTATFTDVDGDLVVIKINKGDINAIKFLTTPVGAGDRLDLIDFDGVGAFDGTDVTISVKRKGPTGDGLTYLGHLEATGINLGNVSIRGDLEEIDCGIGSGVPQAGLKSLKVHSFGRYDINGAVNESVISGRVGSVVIATDFANEHLQVATTDSGLKSLKIGGSLIGGALAQSGFIEIFDQAGSISIGGSVVGGSAAKAGTLKVGNSLGKLNVNGSLIGGAGSNSGELVVEGPIGSVRFGGSLIGGAGPASGSLIVQDDSAVAGDVASLVVKGSLMGGPGDLSGVINIEGAAGQTRIGGSILGGAGVTSGSFSSGPESRIFNLTGSIVGGDGGGSGSVAFNDSDLQKFHLGGSLVGGMGGFSGNVLIDGSAAKVTIDGSIIALATTTTVNGSTTFTITESVGSFIVGGDLLGTSINPVAINVNGQEEGATPQTPTTAIGTLKIGGSAVFSNILTGDSLANPAAVKIGTVSVGRDWVATNLSAGVSSGPDNLFGTDDDTILGTIDPAFSSIAKVIINGRIFGTGDPADHFGIMAKVVGELKLGGLSVALNNDPSAPDNISLGNLLDLNVREDV